MNNTWLSLGSNEGNRLLWMQKAIELLSLTGGTVVNRSSVYETAAWGLTSQPNFLNMVVQLQTDKPPKGLLAVILSIETQLGRQREIKWGPRTLDIDILLYNNDIIELPGLLIPHPYLQYRLFTLTPLAEIAPEYVHPKFDKTVRELLSECPDKLEVIKYTGS